MVFLMRLKTHTIYTRAGSARRCGKGLVMEIAGSNYHLTKEAIPALLMDQAADMLDDSGEQDGVAWLSPMIYPEKHELSALIRDQVFVVGYREMTRVLQGKQTKAVIREYHGKDF